MIAHGAKHPRLQISKSQVVGKTAGVDLSIVVAARIAAVDDHAGSPEASHIRERHRLVVEQQVRLDSAIKGLVAGCGSKETAPARGKLGPQYTQKVPGGTVRHDSDVGSQPPIPIKFDFRMAASVGRQSSRDCPLPTTIPPLRFCRRPKAAGEGAFAITPAASACAFELSAAEPMVARPHRIERLAKPFWRRRHPNPTCSA